MPRVSLIEVPIELKALFDSLVYRLNRYANSSVRVRGRIVPEKKKFDVPNRSLLPQISAEWAGLSDPERAAWNSAAGQTNMKGWNLFVQDTAYRIKYGREGLAVPSDEHQYKVGRVQIEAPASQAIITQTHPVEWFKMQKVSGTKSQYVEVAVNEKLVLPLTVGLSFRTDLTATSGTPRARFYAKVISHYQGRNIETEVGFDLGLQTDWTRNEETLSDVLGVARWYSLYIELIDVRGFIEFDNVLAEHTGSNYARDLRCNDINTQLSRIYFQVAKSWEIVSMPSGSAYDSVYPDD